MLKGATFNGVIRIDPGLATVHSMAGLTKISFVSGHIPGALAEHFGAISASLESLDNDISYRTGAVSPDLAVILAVFGFSVANELVLMRRELDDVTAGVTATEHAWRISAGRLRSAARIDSSAFPFGWALTAPELEIAAQSTGSSGIAFAREGWRRTGFVMAGVSAETAYLQRLAVMPTHQGGGLGAMLTVAALQWAKRSGAAKMFVNTETDNEAAIGLYVRHGFEVCDGKLLVMERTAALK